MKTFEKTISTNKPFDDAVAAVEKKTAEKGSEYSIPTMSRRLWLKRASRGNL